MGKDPRWSSVRLGAGASSGSVGPPRRGGGASPILGSEQSVSSSRSCSRQFIADS